MVKRQNEILGILLLLVLIVSLVSCRQETVPLDESSSIEATQPNILLIVADDLGYSDIGSFGGEIATPTLDRLANEGLRLSGFHVLPSCSPTRSVLLSGTDNHVAGIGTMGELLTPEMAGQPGYEGYLNFQVASLSEVLKAGGYHTYMAGKWHLGHEENTTPHARGFDETFALLPGGGSHWGDMKPLSPPQTMVYSRNGKKVESLPNDFYSTTYYTDKLLEFIDQNKRDGKPFFAYLSYTAPHDPLHAPKAYIDKYKGKYDEGWEVLSSQRLQSLKELGIVHKDAKSFPPLASVKAWNEMPAEERATASRDMEVYAAMIDYMDEQIARVFDYLEKSGEYDNTMIIFLSDNGANGHLPTAYPGQTEEYLGSFDNSLENRGQINSFIETGPGWTQASMTPSRLFKAFTAEGGIRAPLIVKLPGAMPNAGKINHSFFHVRDIMPTILDVAGVEFTQKINGRSVVAMQGSSLADFVSGNVKTPYSVASQVGYELFGMKAFFDGDWKILWMPPPFGPGGWQLYNLREDPGEIVDLSDQHSERVVKMIAQWEQYKEANGVLDISYGLSGEE
jgi:arylsulfatase A-like enzyme